MMKSKWYSVPVSIISKKDIYWMQVCQINQGNLLKSQLRIYNK